MVYYYFTVETDLGTTPSILRLQRLGSIATGFKRISRVMSRLPTPSVAACTDMAVSQGAGLCLEEAILAAWYGPGARFSPLCVGTDGRSLELWLISEYCTITLCLHRYFAYYWHGFYCVTLYQADSSTTEMGGAPRAAFPFRLDSSAYHYYSAQRSCSSLSSTVK
jgi:hypothetical protein